jgi:hypothetical protein
MYMMRIFHYFYNGQVIHEWIPLKYSHQGHFANKHMHLKFRNYDIKLQFLPFSNIWPTNTSSEITLMMKFLLIIMSNLTLSKNHFADIYQNNFAIQTNYSKMTTQMACQLFASRQTFVNRITLNRILVES